MVKLDRLRDARLSAAKPSLCSLFGVQSMGLLDDLPKSAQDLQRQAGDGAERLKAFFESHEAPPEIETIRQRFLAGESASVMLGLEKEHRDAIVRQGLQYLQLNRLDEAHQWLTLAVLADHLDERAIYGLGVIAQLKGDLKTAVRCFIQVQALDATNPEGLLRLGECLLANRETHEAVDCFKGVVALCEAGHGKPRHLEHARKMMSHALANEAAAG